MDTAICKGTNCTAVAGVGHSVECITEHDKLCYNAALTDHINHGGWKCSFCGYNGQNNAQYNRFCDACRRAK